ncbi:MAG: hypothetical protein ABI729_04655 [Chitinophagales bacterium]
MKKYLLVFACLALLFFSCKKEESLVNGKIIDAGVDSIDGCGWLLETDGKQYSPENLDSKFMKNGKEVMTSFVLTGDTFTCGIGAHLHYPVVTITEMKNH